MQQPLIKLSDISFRYENDYVLKNLNLEINRGEFVVIIGENGSGKTTLLNILTKELNPTFGHFTINTNNICYVRQTTLMQQNDIFASVEEVVSLALLKNRHNLFFLNQVQKQRIKDVLEKVGLYDVRKRLISKLSGGQQQRVFLAKALLSNVELLILDEPTSGVDNQSSHTFYKMLDELKSEGVTIVLVTHHSHHLKHNITHCYELVMGQLYLNLGDHHHGHL